MERIIKTSNDRAEEIMARASSLPVECQEQILAVIRGMLFTKEILQKLHCETKPIQ